MGGSGRSGITFLRLLFWQSREPRRILISVSLLFPILIAGGCWIDGTLVMADPGKGLGQHYGYWAFFITTPIIVLLTAYLFDKFSAVIREPDHYCIGLTYEMDARLCRLVRRHLQSLSLRSRTVWIFGFIVFVFFCWWLVNVINTISPIGTYQHDVFDAFSHPYGFYLAKAYLLFVLTVVYSTAIFVALHITVSMYSILKFICRYEILSVNFFHPDNCGGTSQFGNINLIILGIYIDLFAVIVGNYFTHRHTYLAMTASLVACSVLAVAQSLGAVYSIHQAVAQKKRACIDAVTAQLNNQFALSLRGEHFPDDLLAFRNHLLGIRTFPYTGEALVAINVMRLAPVALAFVGYFRHP